MMVMEDVMSIYGFTDFAILKEIGRRLKQKRLEKNISQKDLSELSGLNRSTIVEVEKGKPFSMLTFIQILRALKELDELDSILPEQGISPLQLAKFKGRARKRASKSYK